MANFQIFIALNLILAHAILAQDSGEFSTQTNPTSDPTTTLSTPLDTLENLEHSDNFTNSEETEKEREREKKEIGNGGHGKNSQNSIDEKENEKAVKLNHLDDWEALIDIQKSYPYYQSGFDEDSRPIWIAEVGNWNYRKITESSKDYQQNFDKYCDQIVHRIIKSLSERSTPDNPVIDVTLILDMAEFDLVKMAHLPSVSLILRTLAKFKGVIDQYMYSGIIINATAAAQSLVNLARPVLGRSFERILIFGTNRARWVPQILKYCPRDQVPSWYGGSKDFKAVKVYG